MAASMATIATTIINSISVNPDCFFMSNILLSMVPDKHRWNAIHTQYLIRALRVGNRGGDLVSHFYVI